jgi:hypothetical protein
LAKWQSFYVIIGSPGAALLGVQFVVLALSRTCACTARPNRSARLGRPSVVHFGGALLVCRHERSLAFARPRFSQRDLSQTINFKRA